MTNKTFEQFEYFAHFAVQDAAELVKTIGLEGFLTMLHDRLTESQAMTIEEIEAIGTLANHWE